MFEALPKLETFEEFRDAGLSLIRRSVESIMLQCKLMFHARDKLTTEDFNKLATEMHMARKTAEQYITIAKSERIEKLRKDKPEMLPNSSTILYLIASMDGSEWKEFQRAHKLEPELTAAEVRLFRQLYKAKQEIEHLPKTTAGAAARAAAEAAANATAPTDPNADENELAEAPEGDEAEGSPRLGGAFGKDEEAMQPPMDLLLELGDALMALKIDAIIDSMSENKDEAAAQLQRITNLAEYIERIRVAVSDKEFEMV